MPCPRCGREDCTDPAHFLSNEIFQLVLSYIPPSQPVGLVSHEWNYNNNSIRRVTSRVRGEFLDGTPEGTCKPVWDPRRRLLHFPFVVQISFLPNGRGTNGDFRCCQYRQLVRGSFRINGDIQIHQLPYNKTLSTSVYEFDGPKDSNCCYGQRRWSGSMGTANMYCADLNKRATKYTFNENGAYFQASDDPNILGRPGQLIEIDLEFLGLIIATDTRIVLVRRIWRVKGQFLVPFKDDSDDKDKDNGNH